MSDPRESRGKIDDSPHLKLYTEDSDGDSPSGAPKQQLTKIRIFHNNTLVRDGLAKIFDGTPYEVETFDSHNEKECNDALGSGNPCIVISNLKFTMEPAAQDWMDIHRDKKTGDVPWIVILDREAVHEMYGTLLRKEGPDPSIGSANWLSACMRTGILGYVEIQRVKEEIVQAVEKVLAGKVHLTESLLGSVKKSVQQRNIIKEVLEDSDCPLTPREHEVLQLITNRLSNKQIAKKLCLSLYTVKNHVHNILEKLQAEDRHEAAAIGVKRGWVKRKEIE